MKDTEDVKAFPDVTCTEASMEGMEDMKTSAEANSSGVSKTASMEIVEGFTEVMEASMEVTFMGEGRLKVRVRLPPLKLRKRCFHGSTFRGSLRGSFR